MAKQVCLVGREVVKQDSLGPGVVVKQSYKEGRGQTGGVRNWKVASYDPAGLALPPSDGRFCGAAQCLHHHPSVASVLISVQIALFSSSRRSARVICVSRVSGQGDCRSLFLGLPLRAASQEGGAQLFDVHALERH